MSDPLIGKEVDNGEYRIIERIGSGGMGSVYKAEQPKMNRFVAIKVLHSRYLSRNDLVSRFRREARAMSQLSHPNTARVYKYGQLEDGSFYFVMEYMTGYNLVQEVRTKGPIEADRCINIMVQVCGALEEAHQAGIIHRDLKPENIFLTNQGGTVDFPKVLDFGLAKVSEKQIGSKSLLNLTQQGAVFGTPEFMSPEQALGAPLDRRSDVYSLGLIMYEALTGKLPFDATEKRQVMKAQVKDKPIPLSKRTRDISFSPKLEAVLARALAKDPAERHPTAAKFAEALKGCLSSKLATSAAIAVPAPRTTAAQSREVQPLSNDTDIPKLPISNAPYIVLGIGIVLSVIGIIAIVVSVLGD
ncbi:MAG: serine/threonine protein kinase [Deltaproteobacteria bacterium]|nr:serine/threonine protein kinase [Deltaproteobacteria bacterium]